MYTNSYDEMWLAWLERWIAVCHRFTSQSTRDFIIAIYFVTFNWLSYYIQYPSA